MAQENRPQGQQNRQGQQSRAPQQGNGNRSEWTNPPGEAPTKKKPGNPLSPQEQPRRQGAEQREERDEENCCG